MVSRLLRSPLGLYLPTFQFCLLGTQFSLFPTVVSSEASVLFAQCFPVLLFCYPQGPPDSVLSALQCFLSAVLGTPQIRFHILAAAAHPDRAGCPRYTSAQQLRTAGPSCSRVTFSRTLRIRRPPEPQVPGPVPALCARQLPCGAPPKPRPRHRGPPGQYTGGPAQAQGAPRARHRVGGA